MGRELRRVAANWQHSTEISRHNGELHFIPKFDESLRHAQEEWDAEKIKWENGTHESLKANGGYADPEDYATYLDYNGERPNDDRNYRPDWKPEDQTWYQVYETVSEGTPVTPAFETREELVDYLVANGDYWDQKRRVDPRNRGEFRMPCDPWSREAAENFVMGPGWAPSMVFTPETGLVSGVEFGSHGQVMRSIQSEGGLKRAASLTPEQRSAIASAAARARWQGHTPKPLPTSQDRAQRKADRLFARAEAYEECAGHLELAWTDDPLEREEGEALMRLLMRRVEKLRARARDLPL